MPISSSAVHEAPVPDTLLGEEASLPRGFVQLPKAVLYARNLSRDAKLLFAVLLGYAWQEQRCFPGYQRLCADLEASENAVRTWMRELEDAHLISQWRHGQGRTNLYLFHDLSTAQIEVQDQHQRAVVEPQEAEDNEEAVQQERENKESGVRASNRTPRRNEVPGNEQLYTHSSVFSTAKEKILRSLAGQQTKGFTPLQPSASPPQGHENSERAQGQRNKGNAQAHQLVNRHMKSPEWLPGYMVDFSREFHDEAATASNITRAAHLFERAGVDADAFIAQVYAARRITQGRANIQKRAEVGKNPAWPNGFPNRMPYFFSVLEERLGLKAATRGTTMSQHQGTQPERLRPAWHQTRSAVAVFAHPGRSSPWRSIVFCGGHHIPCSHALALLRSHCMRKQHRWIRQQLICCFIHTYTQVHHLPPTVREIGAWVGCPGMRGLQRALADLERHQDLTRQAHAQRSMVLTAKGIALAERWQLLVPIAGTDASTLQWLGAAS